jgi:hypothetical protein
MQYQQGTVQFPDAPGLRLAGQVFDELAPEGEWPPGELHGGLSLRFDQLESVGELPGDVRRLERRAQRRHGNAVGDAMGRREDGRTAQRMADQQRRGAVVGAQPIRGGDQIIHVGTEMRVGEIAAAAAQPREVETQHAEAGFRQPPRDEGGRLAVLGAGEAMGKHRPGPRRRLRRVESSRKQAVLATGKFDSAAGHGGCPFLNTTDSCRFAPAVAAGCSAASGRRSPSATPPAAASSAGPQPRPGSCRARGRRRRVPGPCPPFPACRWRRT